jgi:hypothetical protein
MRHTNAAHADMWKLTIARVVTTNVSRLETYVLANGLSKTPPSIAASLSTINRIPVSVRVFADNG